MRERETAGHSHRVVKLTLRMAKRARHHCRSGKSIFIAGALLHDIGKMGVLTAFLLKTRLINLQEWEIMRKHPG